MERAPITREDYRACRALLRAGSKSFSAAFRLLPRRIRPAVAATYAFCRVADDLVDRADADPAALEELARRLALIHAGTPQDDPVDRAFASVVAFHAIPPQVPAALVEGFRWDRAGRSYENISEVCAYAVRVASTVGVMMTLIMGERRPEALARACDLGVAMQLTNIARDVGEDARAGRLYLPLERLRAKGVDPAAFRASPAFTPGLGEVVEDLLAEADALYARAESGIALLPRRCRRAIRAARWIYADIGRVVREAGCDSVAARAVTTRGRKLRLLLRASRRCPGERAEPPAEANLEATAQPPLPEAAFLVDAVAAMPEPPRGSAEPGAALQPGV